MTRPFYCATCVKRGWDVRDARLCPHATLPDEPDRCGCGGGVFVSLSHWQDNNPAVVIRTLFCRKSKGLVSRPADRGGCKEDPANVATVTPHAHRFVCRCGETDHTPWARAIFAEQRLWLACYCGWNAMGDAQGTWNDHGDFLDAAWAEAEAALPEGMTFSLTRAIRPASEGTGPTYYATASRPWYDALIAIQVDGPTPAAALRALAAKLRERGA